MKKEKNNKERLLKATMPTDADLEKQIIIFEELQKQIMNFSELSRKNLLVEATINNKQYFVGKIMLTNGKEVTIGTCPKHEKAMNAQIIGALDKTRPHVSVQSLHEDSKTKFRIFEYELDSRGYFVVVRPEKEKELSEQEVNSIWWQIA